MQGARYTCVGFRNRCLWSIDKRNANITVQGWLIFFHRGPAATACSIPRSALVSILLQANEAVDGHALLERELHHLHGGPDSGTMSPPLQKTWWGRHESTLRFGFLQFHNVNPAHKSEKRGRADTDQLYDFVFVIS